MLSVVSLSTLLYMQLGLFVFEMFIPPGMSKLHCASQGHVLVTRKLTKLKKKKVIVCCINLAMSSEFASQV